LGSAAGSVSSAIPAVAKGEFTRPPEIDVQSEIDQQNAEEEARAQRTVDEAIRAARELDNPVRADLSALRGAHQQPAVSAAPNGLAEAAPGDGQPDVERSPYTAPVEPNTRQ
jgi:hypothetical protein